MIKMSLDERLKEIYKMKDEMIRQIDDQIEALIKADGQIERIEALALNYILCYEDPEVARHVEKAILRFCEQKWLIQYQSQTGYRWMNVVPFNTLDEAEAFYNKEFEAING